MSEKKMVEVRYFIPESIMDVLKQCITIKVGDKELRIQKINQFARECMYRGLASYLEPSSSPKVSGSENAKPSAEILRKELEGGIKENV